MRSKLFVPGIRPELFAKALASDADALSFDLEDAVPADGKDTARRHVSEFLCSDAARASSKQMIVRINGLDTPFARDDLAALTDGAARIVNLPKVETPEQVQQAAAATPLQLLVNIETPRGMRRAAEIATAHPNVMGLQAGLNDLFLQLGIARAEPANVHAALWQIRLAAGEAGCTAMDGAWPGLEDDAGFEAEAELARRLGYTGKSCIHPRQIPIANAVFGDSDAVAAATRLLAAAESAAERGHGAFSFEGRMIDRPAIDQARATIAAAERQES